MRQVEEATEETRRAFAEVFDVAVNPAAASCPRHAEWLEVYEAVKEQCDWAAALAFLKRHPETINNFKPPGNWTLLHQVTGDPLILLCDLTYF